LYYIVIAGDVGKAENQLPFFVTLDAIRRVTQITPAGRCLAFDLGEKSYRDV
jgi:hypothetical protein